MGGVMDRFIPQDMADVVPADAVEVLTGTLSPDLILVAPRWWYTTDPATMDRLKFLPDYGPFQGDMVVVGMRAAWQGGDMALVCDPGTGEYFRRGTSETGTVHGRVFAPAPPPVGLWSGGHPDP